jgi:hypothetical protein
VDVAGPAVGELVAAVLLAEHGVGPPQQVGQLSVVDVAVQADPIRRGGSARGSSVEGVGDSPGEFLEPGGEVQVGVEPGLVEPFVEGADLTAQVSDLGGQGGQALAQSAGARGPRAGPWS